MLTGNKSNQNLSEQFGLDEAVATRNVAITKEALEQLTDLADFNNAFKVDLLLLDLLQHALNGDQIVLDDSADYVFIIRKIGSMLEYCRADRS